MAAEAPAEKLAAMDIESTEEQTDVVNPWNVASSSAKGIDYDKLISKPSSNNFFQFIYYP